MKPPQNNLVSIVFSFRNEATNLLPLIQTILTVFEPLKYDFEMIFVNDDSTDNSLEILKRQGLHNPRIKVITTSRRFGVHPCVMAGFKAAKGDAVIYMDTDLQDPPELIPQLLEKWEQGADVVHTRRKKRLGEGKVKMAFTLLAYKIIDAFSEVKIPSNCGDFKLLSRRIVNEIIKMKEYNPFMRGLTYWVGFNQQFVEYVRSPRNAGKTHFSLFGSGPIKEFERGIITFSDIPLKISLLTGFLTSAFAFFYLPIIIITKFVGFNLPGWTAVMCGILLLNGMVLFTIGILGLYVSRIYHEVRARPHYIIKETFNFDSPTHLDERPVECISNTLKGR